MRKPVKTLLVASTLAAGVAAAPTIYARDSSGSDRSMMGQGMMGQDGMMGQMSSMMEHCNEMMQAMKDSESGGQRPNEQWRERTPQQQDRPQSDNAG
jgi:Spy/CpxP family protein refolding chaperone